MALLQKKVSVIHNVALGPEYYRMGFDFPDLAETLHPGQFVMVRVSDKTIPLLRRPFSVHRLIRDGKTILGFELLYKVVGEGTQILTEKKAGDALDVLGPLGNRFSWSGNMRRPWIVAGGVGVASLYYLVTSLTQDASVRPVVFIGGCSAADILCEKEFRSMGAEVRVTTEDCSLGEMGFITSAVERSLDAGEKPDMIYACGPQAMLKTVMEMALSHDILCQVSLESAMACGFGVCLGCAVEKVKEPGTYFHVCTDGPVFDAKDVIL